MGWRSFTEIDAWQLSMELQIEIDKLVERPEVKRNRKFCDEARDAAASPPRNIAEGFEKYGHKEFARFVLIAKGSLGETQTNLLYARKSEFVTEDEFKKLWELSDKAKSATTGLWKYLNGTRGFDGR